MAVEGINVIEREDGVAVLELDLAGEKVNKFSTPVMQHFDEMLEKMMSAKYKGLVVISRKPKIFIAGADINEIKDIVEPADAKQKAAEGQ